MLGNSKFAYGVHSKPTLKRERENVDTVRFNVSCLEHDVNKQQQRIESIRNLD